MTLKKNGSKTSNKYSNYNIGGAIQSSYNQDEYALDVNLVNSFIPHRYTKITWIMKDMGDGTEEVEYLLFHGYGIKEVNEFEITDNPVGQKESSLISFQNKTPEALEGTYFTLEDASGSVGIWFNLDGLTPIPVTGADRDLEVAINTGDLDTDLADATAIVLHADSEYSAISNTYNIIVEDVNVGVRTDISSGTSGLVVNVSNQGVDSLNNKYFIVHNASNEKYHVWYNIGGTGVEPVVVDSTGIEVSLTNVENQLTVAEKTAEAMNLNGDFTVTSDGSFLVVTNTAYGDSDGITQGTTNFKINNLEEGTDSTIVAKIRVYFDDNNLITGFERVE